MVLKAQSLEPGKPGTVWVAAWLTVRVAYGISSGVFTCQAMTEVYSAGQQMTAAKSCLLPVFVNKILVKYCYTHCLWLLGGKVEKQGMSLAHLTVQETRKR